MVLELPDELVSRARAVRLDDSELVAALIEAIERREAEQNADFENAVAGIERGLKDVEAGRVSAAEEIIERVRLKHNLPADWPEKFA